MHPLSAASTMSGVSAGAELSGIVLAAGEARRFGSDKLLALIDGRPVLAHLLRTVRAVCDEGVLGGFLVVTPDAHGAVAELARAYGAAVVVNADRSGLASSVRAGLHALGARREADVPAAAVLFLGDQPGVSAATVAALAAAWRAGGARAVRPRYAAEPEVPGHPLLLDRRAWPLADALDGDSGFGPLFANGRLRAEVIHRPGRNPDVDVPADLTLRQERR